MKNFTIITLNNGIRCVHQRTKSPVAYLAITINSGTRDELKKEHGVAHLVEHLMFKGTKRRSAYQVNSRLESLGGEMNAYTTKEETVVHATCLKNDYRKGVDLLTDMVFNSTFSEAEIIKEKEVIIDEINSYKDSPAELIFDHFEELLFENSALGRNILGNKQVLRSIKQKNIIDFIKRTYNTNQIILSSSANISAEKFTKICNDILGDIPANTRDFNRITTTKQPQFTIEKNKNTHQIHTIIGGYAYSINDPRRIALSLLINILGGPSSLSILNQTLREKRALTYSVEASYTPYLSEGLYIIYFGCESAKHEQAMDLITSEIDKLKDNLLTVNKLSQYKKQFIGQMTLAADNSESMMLSIAKSILTFGEFETIEALAKKISEITPQDISEVANEIFANDNQYKLMYK